MKDLRSSRRLFELWHRREKATIDHVANAVGSVPGSSGSSNHSAFTASGLVVEDQVRKAWQPMPIGLAIF